jgi:hypothetical protein
MGGHDVASFRRRLPRGKILDRLVLTSDPARFDESVRQFYAGLQPGLECVGSGRKLVGDFDVDHAATETSVTGSAIA